MGKVDAGAAHSYLAYPARTAHGYLVRGTRRTGTRLAMGLAIRMLQAQIQGFEHARGVIRILEHGLALGGPGEA